MTKFAVIKLDALKDIELKNVSKLSYSKKTELADRVLTLPEFVDLINAAPEFSDIGLEKCVVAELQDDIEIIDLQEDESHDIEIDNKLVVHIKRNDVGYSVDTYKKANEFSDDVYLDSMTVLEDDLEEDLEEDLDIE
jgi:hypothetical protein